MSPSRRPAIRRRTVLVGIVAGLALGPGRVAARRKVLRPEDERRFVKLMFPFVLRGDVTEHATLQDYRLDIDTITIQLASSSGDAVAKVVLYPPTRESPPDETTTRSGELPSFRYSVHGEDPATRPAVDALLDALRRNDDGEFWNQAATVGDSERRSHAAKPDDGESRSEAATADDDANDDGGTPAVSRRARSFAAALIATTMAGLGIVLGLRRGGPARPRHDQSSS